MIKKGEGYMFFYRLCWFLVWLPVRLLLPTRMIGKKNLPKGKRAIIAGNHQSNWDPVLVDAYMWHRPYVLAKHTLFENKLLGAVLRSYGAIPVNRQEVGISTIKEVMKLLNDDKWLLIFPQGTRVDKMEDGDAIKNGVALFALKTNSPIVPIWFVKKPRIFRYNKILVGEPFYLDEFAGQKPTKEVLSQASDVIIKKMLQLRDDYEAQRIAKKNKKRKKADEPMDNSTGDDLQMILTNPMKASNSENLDQKHKATSVRKEEVSKADINQ